MVMLKLISKIALYAFLSLIILEILVRAFHLYNDRPERFVDEDSLNKWVPGQEGYSVYGNRRQVFTKYHINSAGYNSYREFISSKDSIEVALIGDSFIEGFHQNYDNSIGKKIERDLDHKVQVYEYGHSANDLADQLYTIYSHPDEFRLIDYYVISIRYEDDLTRGEYKPINRVPGYAYLKYSKLLVYAQDIGLIDPVKKLAAKILGFRKRNSKKIETAKKEIDLDNLYLNNFKNLVEDYNLDKSKSTFLLDGSITNQKFLDYLKAENIDFIDYSKVFYNDNVPKTLIFDQHWNDKGRSLIAGMIADYVRKKEENKRLNN